MTNSKSLSEGKLLADDDGKKSMIRRFLLSTFIIINIYWINNLIGHILHIFFGKELRNVDVPDSLLYLFGMFLFYEAIKKGKMATVEIFNRGKKND
jgi:hypothetical protein